MLQLTQKATEHLAQVRNDRGFDRSSVVRFVPNGTAIGMMLSSEPEPGDSVVNTHDLAVAFPPKLAPMLDVATIDIKEQDGKAKLVIRASAGAKARTA